MKSAQYTKSVKTPNHQCLEDINSIIRESGCYKDPASYEKLKAKYKRQFESREFVDSLTKVLNSVCTQLIDVTINAYELDYEIGLSKPIDIERLKKDHVIFTEVIRCCSYVIEQLENSKHSENIECREIIRFYRMIICLNSIPFCAYLCFPMGPGLPFFDLMKWYYDIVKEDLKFYQTQLALTRSLKESDHSPSPLIHLIRTSLLWQSHYSLVQALTVYRYCLNYYDSPESEGELIEIIESENENFISIKVQSILNRQVAVTISNLQQVTVIKNMEWVKKIAQECKTLDKDLIQKLTKFDSQFISFLQFDVNPNLIHPEVEDDYSKLLLDAQALPKEDNINRINEVSVQHISRSLSHFLNIKTHDDKKNKNTLSTISKIVLVWMKYFNHGNKTISEKIVYEKLNRLSYHLIKKLLDKSAVPTLPKPVKSVSLSTEEQKQNKKDTEKIVNLLVIVEKIELSTVGEKYSIQQKRTKPWFQKNPKLCTLLKEAVMALLKTDDNLPHGGRPQLKLESIEYWKKHKTLTTLLRFLFDQLDSDHPNYWEALYLLYEKITNDFQYLSEMWGVYEDFSKRKPFLHDALIDYQRVIEIYNPHFKDLVKYCEDRKSVEGTLSLIKADLPAIKRRLVSVQHGLYRMSFANKDFASAFEFNLQARNAYDALIKSSVLEELDEVAREEIESLERQLQRNDASLFKIMYEYEDTILDQFKSQNTYNPSYIETVIKENKTLLEWSMFREDILNRCSQVFETMPRSDNEKSFHLNLTSFSMTVFKSHTFSDPNFKLLVLQSIFSSYLPIFYSANDLMFISELDYIVKRLLPSFTDTLSDTPKVMPVIIDELRANVGAFYMDVIGYNLTAAKILYEQGKAELAKDRLTRTTRFLDKYSLNKEKILQYHKQIIFDIEKREIEIRAHIESMSRLFLEPEPVLKQPQSIAQSHEPQRSPQPLSRNQRKKLKKSKKEAKAAARQKSRAENVLNLTSDEELCISDPKSESPVLTDNSLRTMSTSSFDSLEDEPNSLCKTLSALDLSKCEDFIPEEFLYQIDKEPPPLALNVVDILTILRSEPGVWAKVVGGYCRDYFLNPVSARPSDIDIITNCLPERVQALLTEFGIVKSPYKPGLFSFMLVDNVELWCSKYHTMKEDANSRDFTINAFYSDDEKVQDPLGVSKDLALKYLKMIGNTEERIADDPKRWFRYINICSKTNKDINPVDVDVLKQIYPLSFQKMSMGAFYATIKELFISEHAESNVRLMSKYSLIANMFTLNASDLKYFPEDHLPYWVSAINAINISFRRYKPEVDVLATFLASEVYVRMEEDSLDLGTSIRLTMQHFVQSIGKKNADSDEFKRVMDALYTSLEHHYDGIDTHFRDQRCVSRPLTYAFETWAKLPALQHTESSSSSSASYSSSSRSRKAL
jgi:hypothetical protein